MNRRVFLAAAPVAAAALTSHADAASAAEEVFALIERQQDRLFARLQAGGKLTVGDYADMAFQMRLLATHAEVKKLAKSVRAQNRDDLINTDEATFAKGKKDIEKHRGIKLDDVPSDYQSRAKVADFAQNLEAMLIDSANQLEAMVDSGKAAQILALQQATSDGIVVQRNAQTTCAGPGVQECQQQMNYYQYGCYWMRGLSASLTGTGIIFAMAGAGPVIGGIIGGMALFFSVVSWGVC